MHSPFPSLSAPQGWIGLLLATSLAAPAALAAQAEPVGTVAELRARLAQLEERYEQRIADLEQRIEELESALASGPRAVEPVPKPEESPPTPSDELAALRRAAQQAAGPTPAAAPLAPGREPATARGNLNRLNPEISATGNVLALGANDDREEFRLQEFELDVQSNLDPYSKMRLTLTIEGDEVGIEEGYVAYPALPGGLSLTAGKFRQQFGTLNRQHLHALPQVEYPLAVQRYFGEEGLAQTGVSLRWLLPKPWATANELTLEVTDAEAEMFGGELFEHLSLLGHLKNYWDLSQAAYFEWGLTGVFAETDLGGDARVLGSDLTLHWQPPQRAKYRELTWRTEALLSQRDAPSGERIDAWGGYSYLEGLLRQNLYLGVRFDYVEDPFTPEISEWAIAPYLTWWQSEFVRLRSQLEILDREDQDRQTRFLLQITWAAGPHKHETY